MTNLHKLAAVLTASAISASLLLGSTPAQADSVPDHGSGAVADNTFIAPNTSGLRSNRMQAMDVAIPESWSLQKWAMPVGDQGKINSCVSWTLGYSQMGWYANYWGQPKTFAPMYVYSQTAYPNDGGSTIAGAYDILTKQGLVEKSQYPAGDYDYQTPVTAEQKQQAAANLVTAPHWLYSVNDWEADQRPGAGAKAAIQTAISANHPVTLSIGLYDPFNRLNPADSTLLASEIPAGAQSRGAHDVLIVGYNSTGVIIQNQWGTNWGDQGYATLGWDFIEKYSLDATWVWGFAANLPAQAPAAPDRVELSVNGGSANISWIGTGDFDDSVRHPVTNYTVKLTGSDGSSRSQNVQNLGSQLRNWLNYTGLSPNVTYSASITATNAIGNGPATAFSFKPGGVSTQQFSAADTPSPAMPAGAAVSQSPVATAPTPVTSAPTTPAKPAITKAPGNPQKFYLSFKYSKKKVTQVLTHWAKPSKLGSGKLSGYWLRVVGKSGSKVKYRHDFTLKSTVKGAALKFTGKNRLVKGAKYTFTLYAKNSDRLYSSGVKLSYKL